MSIRQVSRSVPISQKVESALTGIKEESLASIRGHIPDNCAEAISQLLDIHPTVVKVVERRKTKHGDHRLSPCRRFSIVTVNASGNPYQFLITLLHELDHAKTLAAYGRTATPHGAEWKHAFTELLLNFLGRSLFPERLAPHVRRHAANPRYSSSSDIGLQFNLRAYDTLDYRKTVAELPAGQMFSLDGKLVLTKRSDGAGNHFNCVSSSGRLFRVHALTRIHSLYDGEK